MGRFCGRYVAWLILTAVLFAGSLFTVSEAAGQGTPFNFDLSALYCPVPGGQAVLSGNLDVTQLSPHTFSFQGLGTLQLSNPTNNLADCVGFFPGLILSGSVSIGIVNGFVAFTSDFANFAWDATCNLQTNTLGIFTQGPGGGLRLVRDISFLNLGASNCHVIVGF